MYKASILVLTLAVFASASFNPQVLAPFAEHAGQFAAGFLQGSNLWSLNNVDGCVNAIDKAAAILVPIIDQLRTSDNIEATLSTVDKIEIEGSLALVSSVCYDAITGTYAAILAAKDKKNENYGAFIYNYLTNYETFIADTANMAKAMSEGDYFSAGQVYGTMFLTATGFNLSEIEPILASGEAQYDTMVQGSGNVTGIPVFLQNATLFMEGFGTGFELSDDTNDIYISEVDLYAIYGDFVTLWQNITHGGNILDIMGDINQIWIDFTTAFSDISNGVENLMQVFNPAIQEAKTNSTQLENTFKSNLAAHPLQSAVLAAKFKLDWSSGSWYNAGDAWAQITAIGLKGLYNTTSSA
jgi:hypothetical protein